MKKCLIMRGLPGSGKTTWIKNFFNTIKLGEWISDLAGHRDFPEKQMVVVSADDYFMVNDKYLFRPEVLKLAHKQCMERFMKACAEEKELVIVDNTNSSVWEMSPYVAVADVFDYEVTIMQMITSITTCVARRANSDKDVPPHLIGAMQERMARELIPLHWNRKLIRENEDVLF